MLALSDNIKKLRTKAGISQSHLAKTVGVNQSAICKMEKGMLIPSIATLDDIARALNVAIDDLVRGT
jgi:DNA-binding helix-turn-helix protein